MSQSGIDIAIVHYRSLDDTVQALARLQDWHEGVIWVVDNSAHEADMQTASAALATVCNAHSQVRLLLPGANLGFGRACNLAFAQSQSAFFLLLNPDARIAPTAIGDLRATLDATPSVAAVSPAVYWNTQQSFVLPVPTAQSARHTLALTLLQRSPALARFLARRAVTETRKQMASSHPFALDFVAGSVLLLRRSAVLQAGGLFDPGYFMFFEDADLSLRLRRQGFTLAMVPQVHAVHEYRHKAFKEVLMAQSQQHYFQTHFPKFYRYSHAFERLATLGAVVRPIDWYQTLSAPVSSVQAFARETADACVLAFSPSLLMQPAICRPLGHQPCGFDTAEWDLLEPAHYVALVQAPGASTALRWVHFQKA